MPAQTSTASAGSTNPKGVSHMAQITSVNEAREAGLSILASSDIMVAVYFDLPFGEVAVDREGVVRFASEWEAGR